MRAAQMQEVSSIPREMLLWSVRICSETARNINILGGEWLGLEPNRMPHVGKNHKSAVYCS